jgi:hypothetical protein
MHSSAPSHWPVRFRRLTRPLAPRRAPGPRRAAGAAPVPQADRATRGGRSRWAC